MIQKWRIPYVQATKIILVHPKYQNEAMQMKSDKFAKSKRENFYITITILEIEQKGMTLDYDFCYSFPFFYSLLKKGKKKRRME